jgi:hypothetical protein
MPTTQKIERAKLNCGGGGGADGLLFGDDAAAPAAIRLFFLHIALKEGMK